MVSVKNLSKDRDFDVPGLNGSAKARPRFSIVEVSGDRARRPLSPLAVLPRGWLSPGKEGFTIIEVVMATMVLALAIGSALTVLARGFSSLDSARCFSYASQIMQGELEKMRMTPWGDGTAAGNGSTGVTSYPTASTPVSISSTYLTSGAPVSRMALTRTVADVHTGMLKVTFTMQWTTFDGQTMSRDYTTYYAKKGLYDYFL